MPPISYSKGATVSLQPSQGAYVLRPKVAFHIYTNTIICDEGIDTSVWEALWQKESQKANRGARLTDKMSIDLMS